jgi:hypothetical protein
MLDPKRRKELEELAKEVIDLSKRKPTKMTEREMATGIPDILGSILLGTIKHNYDVPECTVIFARFLEDERFSEEDKILVFTSVLAVMISPKNSLIYYADAAPFGIPEREETNGYGVDHSKETIPECLRIEKDELDEAYKWALNEMNTYAGDENNRAVSFITLSKNLITADRPLLVRAFCMVQLVLVACKANTSTTLELGGPTRKENKGHDDTYH